MMCLVYGRFTRHIMIMHRKLPRHLYDVDSMRDIGK
jgi:hypothetical protein